MEFLLLFWGLIGSTYYIHDKRWSTTYPEAHDLSVLAYFFKESILGSLLLRVQLVDLSMLENFLISFEYQVLKSGSLYCNQL